MSQPQYFARFAALLRGLGDQEPSFGSMERSIVPVLVVGDASQLVPPLAAAQSLLGCTVSGGGAPTLHACVQISTGAVGGLYCDLAVTAGAGAHNLVFRVTETPVALAASFPLLPQALIDGGAQVAGLAGHADPSTFTPDLPVIRRGGGGQENNVVLPFGSTLEVVLRDDQNATIYAWMRVRNLEKNARLGET